MLSTAPVLAPLLAAVLPQLLPFHPRKDEGARWWRRPQQWGKDGCCCRCSKWLHCICPCQPLSSLPCWWPLPHRRPTPVVGLAPQRLRHLMTKMSTTTSKGWSLSWSMSLLLQQALSLLLSPPCQRQLPPYRPAAAIVVTVQQRLRRWMTMTSTTTGKGLLLLLSLLSLQQVLPPSPSSSLSPSP